jgi:hypothetical protein
MASAITKSERLSNALKRARDRAEEATERGTRATLVVVGGGAAGFIEAKYPTIGVSTLSPATLIGGAALLVGLTGFAKAYSDELVSVGAGMLAGVAKDEVKQHFS